MTFVTSQFLWIKSPGSAELGALCHGLTKLWSKYQLGLQSHLMLQRGWAGERIHFQDFVALSSFRFLVGCWTKEHSFEGHWLEATVSSLPPETSQCGGSKPARERVLPRQAQCPLITSTQSRTFCRLCRILVVTKQVTGHTCTRGPEHQEVGIPGTVPATEDLHLLLGWKAVASVEGKSIFRDRPGVTGGQGPRSHVS